VTAKHGVVKFYEMSLRKGWLWKERVCKMEGFKTVYYSYNALSTFWLSSVQRARRLGGEKERKKEEMKKEYMVKHKSTDMYVRRPNY